MIIRQLIFVLFIFVELVTSVKIASFLGNQQNVNYLWKSDIPPATSLTLCYRFKFSSLMKTNCILTLEDGTSNDDLGLHQPISAVLDLESLWYSLGGLRTRHKLEMRFGAYTWYHACVTYSHKFKMITSYINGQEIEVKKGDINTTISGTRLKVGSCSKEENFHGDISQVNIWNRVLSASQISKISDCETDDQGNVVRWNSKWNLSGQFEIKDVDIKKFCEDSIGTTFFIFPPMSMNQAHGACKSITGVLPTPSSEEEYLVYSKFISDTPNLDNTTCPQYWVGATDSEQENVWRKKDESKVDLYWGVREPGGQETENCAAINPEYTTGVYDTSCIEIACSICILDDRPIWSIMGSCEKYLRNRYFKAVQDTNGEIIFNGYADYQIYQNTDDSWVWKDLKENTTIATLVINDRRSDISNYPFGRKLWKLSKPVCEQIENETLTVLLTPCKNDEFTCNDASCIPLWQRCDLKPNCFDQSDEQNCRLIDIPDSYRADIPPLSTTENSSLPITLGVVLESIDINTADMRMHVNINLTMTWRDSRVQYRNLNQDRTLNRVKFDLMQQMWVPVVDFTNTRGNHITQTDMEATMAVNMQGSPTIGDDSQAEEVEFYAGAENSISIFRKYSETFQCHFDLSRYPFDEQICQMELTMLSASSRLLIFDSGSYAVFTGNKQLVEYTVQGVGVNATVNDADFSVLFVEVGLVRRAGFILMNVYVPSMCLLIITYLTLYFKPTIFQVRVLATLTSLLVMTTLFTQASSHLPKTSYFKSVDVWLLTSLIIIFTVIVCHIIIDRSIDDTPPKIPLKSSIAKLVKRKKDLLPMTSVSSARQRNTTPSTTIDEEEEEEETEIDWTRYLILSSRIFVFIGILIFNIIYWTVALSSQE